MLRISCLVYAAAAAAACSHGMPGPVNVDVRTDACASCRMAVSNPKLAAQLIEPGEEPRIFDDIGCLVAYTREHPLGSESAVYVADHRTGAWVTAQSAVFTRVDSIETPMGSHIVAHADESSREAEGIRGPALSPAELLGGTR